MCSCTSVPVRPKLGLHDSGSRSPGPFAHSGDAGHGSYAPADAGSRYSTRLAHSTSVASVAGWHTPPSRRRRGNGVLPKRGTFVRGLRQPVRYGCISREATANALAHLLSVMRKSDNRRDPLRCSGATRDTPDLASRYRYLVIRSSRNGDAGRPTDARVHRFSATFEDSSCYPWNAHFSREDNTATVAQPTHNSGDAVNLTRRFPRGPP